MSLRVAVQMDPLESVNIQGDTSFALMEAAQARGHELFEHHPNALTFHHGAIRARGRPVRVRREQGSHAEYGDWESRDLRAGVDIILMRQDPPFDMGYITAAHILEMLHGETLVMNDPFWVRSSPEKILPLDYPELMPETLVTRDAAEIRAFRERVGDMIVKPLYGNGGAGVFALRKGDSNLSSLLEMFFQISREPVMVQAFVKGVEKGDKRVILIDGEPVGAINRVPQKGETRSNMHVGGTAEPDEVNADDRRICETIGPMLKQRGLTLVGIDVIAGKLTEINVTSPTGVQELKRFSGVDAAQLFWDAAERRWSEKDWAVRP